jgi:mRNA interferase HigB
MPYYAFVNVVSRRKLLEFWLEYPEAEEVLSIWYRTFQKAMPRNFAELKSIFGSVDLAEKYTVFDVGGNKFRVIVLIDYEYQFAKIRHVFTHQMYDQWNAQAERQLEERQKREQAKLARKRKN